MTNPINKRCMIYLRVSTSRQATEGTSIETQLQLCQDFIKQKIGVDACIEIVTDAGKSGKTLARPGIQRILSAIEAQSLDVFCVFSLDRLSRSNIHILQILQLVSEKKITFLCVRQGFSTTDAAGLFPLAVHSAAIQLEYELIRERVIRGKNHIKNMGKYGGGPVPFGYVACRDSLSGLEIVELEAKTIRSIFFYRHTFDTLFW